MERKDYLFRLTVRLQVARAELEILNDENSAREHLAEALTNAASLQNDLLANPPVFDRRETTAQEKQLVRDREDRAAKADDADLLVCRAVADVEVAACLIHVKHPMKHSEKPPMQIPNWLGGDRYKPSDEKVSCRIADAKLCIERALQLLPESL